MLSSLSVSAEHTWPSVMLCINCSLSRCSILAMSPDSLDCFSPFGHRPEVPVPQVPLLRVALTPASACEPWNLELAELVGDTVLDHLAACYMYTFVK
jgi:hypothetical protein